MMRLFAGAAAALLLLVGGALAQTSPVIPAATTNASVSITTGNTFQTILTAPARPAQWRSLTIQNNNASDNCWITVDGGTATKARAIMLLPGGAYTRYYPYVPGNNIQATCATTADTLYVDYQ